MLTFTKIRKWARDRNLINGSDSKSQCLKGISELGELADAILKGDKAGIVDGIGDVVVVLTILAAQNNLDIEGCIEAAYEEIKDRKGVMFNGAFIKESDERYASILLEIEARKNGN